MNEGKQRDGNMGGSDGFSWRAGVRRVFGMECLGWCSKFQEAVEGQAQIFGCNFTASHSAKLINDVTRARKRDKNCLANKLV